MGNTELISVIVPVYNTREYLERCVGSLLAQTYKNLEILLVDDGSTDGTGKLCDTLAGRDGRIRVLHKENGGTSSARNLGIANAKGQFLGFVDSDDFVDPDMYERLLQAIHRYAVPAAQIGRDELDADGGVLPDICVPPGEDTVIEVVDFLRELLLHKGDCSFCTKLIDRDCFAGLAFPEGKLNEDFYLLVEMLPRLGKIVSLPGHAYHVCYRLGSNTRKEEKENFSRVYGDCVENADRVLALVKREEAYRELLPQAFRFGVFQRLEYLLHIPIGQMRRDNQQYQEIVRWMRKNWLRAMGNSVLTVKNKVYHTLFAIAPRTIRVFHKRLRRV